MTLPTAVPESSHQPATVDVDVLRTYRIWIALGIFLLLLGGIICDKPDSRIPINWFYGLTAGDAGIVTVRLRLQLRRQHGV